MDRELKEEAERIRKENQVLLQKEREQMNGPGSTTSEEEFESHSTHKRIEVDDSSSNLTSMLRGHAEQQPPSITDSELSSKKVTMHCGQPVPLAR